MRTYSTLLKRAPAYLLITCIADTRVIHIFYTCNMCRIYTHLYYKCSSTHGCTPVLHCETCVLHMFYTCITGVWITCVIHLKHHTYITKQMYYMYLWITHVIHMWHLWSVKHVTQHSAPALSVSELSASSITSSISATCWLASLHSAVDPRFFFCSFFTTPAFSLCDTYPLHVGICLFTWYFVVNCFAHFWQENSRSPECTFMCFL